MAAAKRYTTEQIVAKLREMEKLQAGVVDPGGVQAAGDLGSVVRGARCSDDDPLRQRAGVHRRWPAGMAARGRLAPVHVAKASPQQNGFIERFNGSMRDELLNRESFHSLTEAKVVIGQWVRHYNEFRPHSGIGMRPPAAFAEYCRAHPPTTVQAESER